MPEPRDDMFAATPIGLEIDGVRTIGKFLDLAGDLCSIEDGPDLAGLYIGSGGIGSDVLLSRADAAALWPLIKNYAEYGRMTGPKP